MIVLYYYKIAITFSQIFYLFSFVYSDYAQKSKTKIRLNKTKLIYPTYSLLLGAFPPKKSGWDQRKHPRIITVRSVREFGRTESVNQVFIMKQCL